eukprot:300401-Prymnesium_polylepis.2
MLSSRQSSEGTCRFSPKLCAAWSAARGRDSCGDGGALRHLSTIASRRVSARGSSAGSRNSSADSYMGSGNPLRTVASDVLGKRQY